MEEDMGRVQYEVWKREKNGEKTGTNWRNTITAVISMTNEQRLMKVEREYYKNEK